MFSSVGVNGHRIGKGMARCNTISTLAICCSVCCLLLMRKAFWRSSRHRKLETGFAIYGGALKFSCDFNHLVRACPRKNTYGFFFCNQIRVKEEEVFSDGCWNRSAGLQKCLTSGTVFNAYTLSSARARMVVIRKTAWHPVPCFKRLCYINGRHDKDLKEQQKLGT